MEHADPFRVVRLPREKRQLDRDAFLAELSDALRAVDALVARGEVHASLPDSPQAVLGDALDKFDRYHRSHAVRAEGPGTLCIEDPRLCLYYRNRLTHLDLEDA